MFWGERRGTHVYLQRRGRYKVDPPRGSKDLSLGTQLVPPGVGIPRHVHAYWDEVIMCWTAVASSR